MRSEEDVSALARVCMCDSEYFMVKERVSSDGDRCGLIPGKKAPRIRNDQDKTSGSGQSRTLPKITYLHVEKKKEVCEMERCSNTHMHLVVPLCWMALRVDNIQLRKVKSNPWKLPTTFFMCAARSFSSEVRFSPKHHNAHKTWAGELWET